MSFIENRASMDDNKHNRGEEEYIFQMKDNYHEFGIDIRTMVSMVAFAEREGLVPELPTEWLSKIHTRYPQGGCV